MAPSSEEVDDVDEQAEPVELDEQAWECGAGEVRGVEPGGRVPGHLLQVSRLPWHCEPWYPMVFHYVLWYHMVFLAIQWCFGLCYGILWYGDVYHPQGQVCMAVGRGL